MSSHAELEERIKWLERELPPNPPRFKIHDDLPFAILRYEPHQEWALRREARLLATRLSNHGVQVVTISLAELLWRAVDESEGMDALVQLERDQGFEAAQKQINTYLSDDDFSPLPRMLADRLASLDPKRNICFLLRTASLAPGTYHISKLLEQMQGKTRVPTILFYPGERNDTVSLRFMSLPGRDALGSYRVRIYG
jgi:hypothetical protein